MQDYVKLSCEHKKLVRRLVSPRVKDEDWEEFYATIRGMVTKWHAEDLSDEAGLSVDDFVRGELTEFLRENNNARLLQFLNLKSDKSDHQHFFGSWFGKVILSAKDRAILRDKREVSIDKPINGDGSSDKNGTSPMTIVDAVGSDRAFESKRVRESVTLSELLRRIGADGFSRLMARFWAKNPQETYIALMDAQLNYRYRKIAALIGKPESLVRDGKTAKKEEISVAGKLRNLRRKFSSKLSLEDLEEIFPFLEEYSEAKLRANFATFIAKQGEGFFGADGEPDADLVEQLGSALETLYFQGESGDWKLELKMPFAVSDKSLIRGALSDGKGGVPKGTLHCCGKTRKVRENGHFEFPVAEFKEFSTSSEMHFTPVGGKRTNGVPFVPDEFDELRPTPELLKAWAARKMSESNPLEIAADLLDDFGYVLPQLILKDEALAKLPFERFGVPLFDRKHLRREYNEAFVLFRDVFGVDPDSPLSSDGFLLPLEWRYNSFASEVPSNILPLHLSALGRRVAENLLQRGDASSAFDDKSCQWQLQPSLRFFNDRVDFSSPGLLGWREVNVASATGALAVAFTYVQNGVRYGGWPFSSLQYDFSEGKPRGVGGIAQKIALTEVFGGKMIFVAPEQQEIPVGESSVTVRKVSETSFSGMADEIAFNHLNRMRPSRPVRFKTVAEAILAPRKNLSEDLYELANKKEHLEDTGTFVVLLGKPGMGKSVLMGLLHKRCTVTNKAFGYVCLAGVANQGWEFVKSLAHGLASTYGEVTDVVMSIPLPDSPPSGEALRVAYRTLVVDPLRRIIEKRKGEKLFILVDGLDEDASGEVIDLLLDSQLRFPARVGVVVSSRHIVQDEERLEAMSTDVMDLDSLNDEYARNVREDVCTYIEQWHNIPAVYDRLLESNIDSEELKDAILKKDRSFLYASYVLGGIAEGRYRIKSVDELAQDLPNDLKACFYDAFKARFPDGETYGKVKPLLRLLVRRGCVDADEAGHRSVIGDETLGAVLKSLRGYAVESDGEIALASEALRMWLKDATHNAEFGV